MRFMHLPVICVQLCVRHVIQIMMMMLFVWQDCKERHAEIAIYIHWHIHQGLSSEVSIQLTVNINFHDSQGS